MTEKPRPLPKFGEWDTDDPALAGGFTVIFNQARDDKKTKKVVINNNVNVPPNPMNKNHAPHPPRPAGVPPRRQNEPYQHARKGTTRWLCCGAKPY